MSADYPAPPPPPPGAPPPVYQPPANQPIAVYQPPAPDYQAPQSAYPSGWMPGQPAQPYMPPAVAVGGTGALMYQFGGAAAWSIGIGLVSIMLPFVLGWYLPIAPIIGLLNGWRATTRGRVIGGIVGIAINCVGGLVSLFASGLIGR